MTRDSAPRSGRRSLTCSAAKASSGFGIAFCSNGDCPNKAQQFPTYGGNDLGFVLSSGGESFVARVQSTMRFQADIFNGLR